MNILFIRTLNPFYESSADANRFSGLLKGLMEKGVKVTILVTRGYKREFLKALTTLMLSILVRYLIIIFGIGESMVSSWLNLLLRLMLNTCVNI